ncbi:polysaccharide transporter, PST family [Pseudomonas sp. NFACC23-1]|uniref:O-antigen translocase n=1 Tax=unclassified Pseudomonas TaxID=196821 RepID=UPI00087ED97E|nr:MULTISPECIES: O-antigen translocase [unclassified Pseudomonas]SDB07175.1 polysaccharide transporter, PST family [Pseudomonas sp. NFACC17-2]SEI96351.1 polysaccharide transporter, PST family [Pseudomonas sp. NFACC23-1]SFW33349.1 polysaccharide transporter, PST family [Pseudomonas sp. NFACC16-2]
MTLIKTSLLNGIAVIIKMLTLLGINKILAIYVGPIGYAALGQFQNAVQMITTFASGAINTGVVKYTAEYHDDPDRQHKVWRTAGSIAFIGSVLTAVLIALFNQSMAKWFLKDEQYGGVFLWFAATLIFFVFNTLILAILNGKKEVGRYVLANIAGSLFALIVTSVMSVTMGLYGALVALAIYQSLSFFVTCALLLKAPWFKFKYLLGGIDKSVAKDLAKYTAMALTSAACVPLSHIFIRNHLGETLGWESAGYWEAMWRLSSAYLMLVTTTLGVYYLPRLAELKLVKDIKEEIFQGYKIIMPIVVIGAILVYLLRDRVVHILFSVEFYPMRDLFAWQLVGDTLRIGSWIVSYLMLSKAMFKPFMVTEVVFSAMFYGLSLVFTQWLGIQGVVLAYAINYLIYWAVIYFLIFKKLAAVSAAPIMRG